MGRPTKYTKKLAEIILERVMLSQGIAEIGRDDTMPDASTIFRWLAKDDDFCDRYTRAKAISADHMEEDMLDIADNGENDWMERNDSEGENIGWQVNGEHIQRSRLRIETRKWLMSKLKPKKYGDKLVTENKNTNVNIDTGDMSDAELLKIIKG